MENVEWSLPVVFSFNVMIGGIPESFQAVEGMEESFECEEVRSGGDNSRAFYLPKAKKNTDLVLKKGFLRKDSPLYLWCLQTFAALDTNVQIFPQTIIVSLLDEKRNPVSTWIFAGAYPYKWSIGSLDAMKSELVIESISLKYNWVKAL